MKYWLILFFIALVFIAGCTNIQNSNVLTTASDLDYRLVISFQSPANGIDKDADAKLTNYIANYGKVLAIEKVYWGMEGERDYCFKLSELSKNEQGKFILSKGDWLVKNFGYSFFCRFSLTTKPQRCVCPGQRDK